MKNATYEYVYDPGSPTGNFRSWELKNTNDK